MPFRPLDKLVIDHWQKHSELLPTLFTLPADHIQELIDAVPPGVYPELIGKLKDQLYADKM